MRVSQMGDAPLIRLNTKKIVVDVVVVSHETMHEHFHETEVGQIPVNTINDTLVLGIDVLHITAREAADTTLQAGTRVDFVNNATLSPGVLEIVVKHRLRQ